MLTTVAVAFVVLGFLASYFKDYFRLILIFFLAWLLAFLISPVADWLQRRLRAPATARRRGGDHSGHPDRRES